MQVLQCMLSVVRLQIVMSQHQRMFQSIVINLEEQNKEMMSRLKQDGASGGGGEGMQMQGPNSIDNIWALALAVKFVLLAWNFLQVKEVLLYYRLEKKNCPPV